jgi:hypothetical protein
VANSLYDLARQSFLSQNPALDWDTDTIKVMLVKNAQAFSNAHQFVSDLTGGNIVQRSAALSSKTVTAGVADAADLTLSAVPSGSTCVIVVYKDTGSDATSPLIAWLDTGTLLPVVTNGGDITIQWDSGTNRIFKL